MLDLSMTLGDTSGSAVPWGLKQVLELTASEGSEDSGFPSSKQDASPSWGCSAELMESLLCQPPFADIKSNHPMDKGMHC